MKYNRCYAITTLIFVLAILVSSTTGCSSGKLKSYVGANIPLAQNGKIAVLPLQNLTADKFAAKKIEGLLIMDFLARGIDVIEPGEVMSALRQSNFHSVDELPVEELQNIGRMIHADVVIIGSVGTFAINKGIAVSYPEVSVHLIMIDIASGKIVWSAWHTSGGPDFWTRHFGAEGSTLDEVAREVIREAVDTLF